MVTISFLDTADFSAEDYQKILDGLSEDRRERAERYRTKRAAYLSAGAGYLLSRALKEAGLAGKTVCYGEHGKPYVEGFHFNLSHSGTIAVLAAADGEVGIDIQKVIPAREGLIKRVCTEREREYLGGCSQEEREREFFRLWTAKESAGKYFGTGITDPKEFEIDLLQQTVSRGGKKLKISLKEYPLDGYCLIVCADEPFAEQLKTVKPEV